ncbi:putative cysteine desulfurase [Hordeum vulgare]|nr:putative cysteine desulfurase [Hordeum vulgare]
MPLLAALPVPISVTAATDTVCTAGATSPASNADVLPFDDLVLGDGEGSKDETDDDAAVKLEWLRSQIIGAEAEFASPFGTRRITYADHTASGRCLLFIEQFVERNLLPYYGNTHTVDSYVGMHTSRLAEDAVWYVKRSLGGGPQDVLLFCGTGCTAAIKRLQEVTGMAVPPTLRSRVLEVLPPSDRWVVFVGPYEHHSNLLSWRESLAEVVEIRLRQDDGLVDMAALEAALAAPERAGRPMLGSFSACSNVTGLRTDTRALARLLHRHGAFACFDFACSAPYVDIDMRSGEPDGYDAVFLSAHKFLGGPGSPGVLAMASRLYRLRRTAPSTSGGGTVLYVSAYGDTVYCEDTEEREDAGTPAIIQKVRAALAFKVKEWVGAECIEEGEQRMLSLALGRIRTAANPNLRLLLGGDPGTTAGRLPVLSFVVHPPVVDENKELGAARPQLHCRFVTKLLNDLFGVQARGGCACAGPYGHRLLGITPARAKAIKSAVEMGYHGVRPGWTRVSLAYYTSTREAEFVLEAIDFVASFGHRFLPLYTFDWKSGDWLYNRVVPNNGVADTTTASAAALESHSGEVKAELDYQSYMAFARNLADSLLNAGLDDAPARAIPKAIDPQLVYFTL